MGVGVEVRSGGACVSHSSEMRSMQGDCTQAGEARMAAAASEEEEEDAGEEEEEVAAVTEGVRTARSRLTSRSHGWLVGRPPRRRIEEMLTLYFPMMV